MKTILIIILGLMSVAYGQTVGQFRYDSTMFWKNGGSNELIIMNSTRGVTGGVLTNTGNGRTAWVAPASLNLLTGNILYVDDIYGNNATAAANKPYLPYLTLGAAKAAATSGYTIIVRPGTYTVTASLAKDEVDWYFQPGTVVTFADDIVTTGIWDDGGTSMQFKVKGSGKFTRSSTDDVLAIKTVNVTHASSDIIIEADQLICTAGDNAQASVIYQTAGLVDINSRLITGTGGSMYAVWWFNGDMYINTSKLYSDYSGFVSDVSATPTGDANIQAFEIATTVAASSTGIAVGNTGTNADAAFWIHANIITGKIQSAGLNKLYVECQKIIGTVESTPGAGLIYVTADKIVDAGEGMIEIGAGTARINVDHLDPATFNGDIVVSAGILYLNGADYVSSATSDGLTISGGTAILTDVNINTAANASTFPITKSGGTLTLRNNLLTAQAAVNGISAPAAQTVISYGSVSNRPLDSDVVLSGDMTINSLSYNSNIASGSTANVLYYDATTEQITYGAASSGSQTPWTSNINADGFTLFGNDGSGETLTLGSTSHATKGKILFGTSAYDEVNNRIGIGNASPSYDIHINKTVNGLVAFNVENQSSGTLGRSALFLTRSLGADYYGAIEYANENSVVYTPLSLNFYTPGASTGGMFFTNIASAPIVFGTNNTTRITILGNGNTGFGISPTALLHIKAGTATASTAPLKFTTGTILTAAEAGVMEYNGTHYLTKASGLRYATEGTIADFYTDVNNGTTVETDIYTYTTPASTLANDGEKIFFSYTLNLSDVTATATVKCYFAGTSIANTGALTVSATGAVIVNGWIIRTGATTARASVNISSPTASTAVYTSQTDLTGLTLSGTNILKVTAQAGGAGGGSNDITGKSGTVSWRGLSAN